MAVNQSQVDHIIASASSDDPEVKLLKLQDEVELIKTSIKRLLIDIRERMNDLENPIVVSGGRVSGEDVSASMAHVMRDTSSAIESAASAIKSTTEMRKAEEQAHGASTQPPSQAQYTPQPGMPQGLENPSGYPTQIPAPAVQGGQSELDLFTALRSQLATLPKEDEVSKATIGDKVRLQKVFRLFEWTSRNVKRFGHDRVEIGRAHV